MENIYTYRHEMAFYLICHTSVGDPTDKHGRYFESGKTYKAYLEPVDNATLMWVNFNEGFGNRFAVVNNIFHDGKPYWDDFKSVFYCPIEIERKNKINKIMNLK